MKRLQAAIVSVGVVAGQDSARLSDVVSAWRDLLAAAGACGDAAVGHVDWGAVILIAKARLAELSTTLDHRT